MIMSVDESQLSIQPVTPFDVDRILGWRYAAPYDFYDLDPRDDAARRAFLDPAHGYHAIRVGSSLVGFCSFGPDARVQGFPYEEDALDIGMGLDPERTGHGEGGEILQQILHWAERNYGRVPMRATIAEFNTRAVRLCERAGFARTARFIRDDGCSFLVLIRPAGAE